MTQLQSRWRLSTRAASTVAIAGLVAAAAGGVFATIASARVATTSVDDTYLADTLGLPADTVIDTVTYDRFQWLLRQPGQFAFVIGSKTDTNFKVQAQQVDAAAKAAGATKVYWFDPNLTGETGVKNLDTRNPGGINLVASSQTIYGNVWKNVLGQSIGNGIKSVSNAAGNTVTITADDTVINDSVDPAWDFRTGQTQAVSSTANVFFVYDKDNVDAGSGAADKIVDWVDLSTDADIPGASATALAAIGGGSVIDNVDEFKWWQSENNRIQALSTPVARYGGPILDDVDDDLGWNVEQLTYPELLHLLNRKDSADQNFVVLFGGTWCPNTRAVIKFVNEDAVANGVKVYNFDLVLDGGKINGTNGGSNPIHVRDNANSGSTFNFRPSWVYGDVARTYFRNLVTQYDPQTGNRVAYYPGGDLNAFPDVVRKLQVPFLINYQRGTGTNPSSTSIKRQWIQQKADSSTGLATFTEYMTNWWFTEPSDQLGLNFAIPSDPSALTGTQATQYQQALANVAFAQEALTKLEEFFGGLPGSVVSTQSISAPSVVSTSQATVTLKIENTLGRTATGNASLTVNGLNYSAPITNNQAVFTVALLPAGSYPLSIGYAGDAQVIGFTTSGTLTVTAAPTSYLGSADSGTGKTTTVIKTNTVVVTATPSPEPEVSEEPSASPEPSEKPSEEPSPEPSETAAAAPEQTDEPAVVAQGPADGDGGPSPLTFVAIAGGIIGLLGAALGGITLFRQRTGA